MLTVMLVTVSSGWWCDPSGGAPGYLSFWLANLFVISGGYVYMVYCHLFVISGGYVYIVIVYCNSYTVLLRSASFPVRSASFPVNQASQPQAGCNSEALPPPSCHQLALSRACRSCLTPRVTNLQYVGKPSPLVSRTCCMRESPETFCLSSPARIAQVPAVSRTCFMWGSPVASGDAGVMDVTPTYCSKEVMDQLRHYTLPTAHTPNP